MVKFVNTYSLLVLRHLYFSLPYLLLLNLWLKGCYTGRVSLSRGIRWMNSLINEYRNSIQIPSMFIPLQILAPQSANTQKTCHEITPSKVSLGNCLQIQNKTKQKCKVTHNFLLVCLPNISWPNRFCNANFPLYTSPSTNNNYKPLKKGVFGKYKSRGLFWEFLQYLDNFLGWDRGVRTPASRTLLCHFPYLFLPAPALFSPSSVPYKLGDSKHLSLIHIWRCRRS